MTVNIPHRVAELLAAGWDKAKIARELGITRPKVQRLAKKIGHPLRNEAMDALHSSRSSFVNGEHTTEVKVPRFIKTEAEALEASGIDLTRWTPTRIEIRHYPVQTKAGVVQGSYVKVGCRPKTLTDDPARIVEAVTKGLEKSVTPHTFAVRVTAPPAPVLRTRIITDTHFGGYAWSKSTGGPSWDIDTALSLAYAANAQLDEDAPPYREACLAFLGDICHYDTTKGSTSGGTPLDIDSRADLVLEAATEFMAGTISESAARTLTYVVIVPGNHDAMLTKALRQAMRLHFKRHRNVTFAEGYSNHQWWRWGKNVLGFSHGDSNADRLAARMANDCGALGIWDGSVCREIHSGHLHHEAAKQRVLGMTNTTHGIVQRTHVALTPPDQYHADGNWVGASRGMSDWYYHHAGGMIGNRFAIPRLLEAA